MHLLKMFPFKTLFVLITRLLSIFKGESVGRGNYDLNTPQCQALGILMAFASKHCSQTRVPLSKANITPVLESHRAGWSPPSSRAFPLLERGSSHSSSSRLGC